MEIKNVGFIGFGLIAGDIARCIHAADSSINIKVFNQRYPDVKIGLSMALDDGVASELSHDLNDFANCDIIFLCAPVLVNVTYLKQLKPIIKKECILTDVGSVKGNIHLAIEELGLTHQFIGGHPMAGSEKTGYENSTLTMLHNAFYLLTPTKETPQVMIDTMITITQWCGCRHMVLNADEHDIAAAAISHVPHILSYSLVNTVKDSDNDQQFMKQFAAGGFRDMTRIAASSPAMWESIVLSNKNAVLTFLNAYEKTLTDFRTMLEQNDSDGIYNFFEKSKEYRDTFTF